MIRILFLINSLERGGAERQLSLLVKAMDRTRFAVTVATIYDGGPLRAEIDTLENIQIVSARKQGRWDYLRPIWRLTKLMIRTRPPIIHGYLDVANELATILGKAFKARVVWGIRASNIDFSLYDRRAAWHFRIAACISATVGSCSIKNFSPTVSSTS